MIKNALEYLVSLGKAERHEIGGQQFTDKPLHLVKEPVANELQVSTLSSLVDYLKSDFLDADITSDYEHVILLHIKSPTEVLALSPLNNDKNRDKFIRAIAPIPEFYFDRWYDRESFNIKLQSCFVKNDDRNVMLKVVGNTKEEMVKEIGDDGISQAVVAKTGIASVGNVEVPNPVSLAPYRTFVEVEQPTSDFIFRMQNGPECALFEADGGKWKLEAIDNIRNFLLVLLNNEVESGKVTIIA